MSTFRFFSFIFVVSSCLATTSSAYRMLHVKHSQIKKSSVWGASTRRIAAVRPLLAAEENKESDFPSMFQGSAATDKTSETSDKPLVSRYKNLNYGEEVEVKWRDPLMESNTRIQFGDFVTPVLIIYPLVLLANDQLHFMPQSFSIVDTLMGN